MFTIKGTASFISRSPPHDSSLFATVFTFAKKPQIERKSLKKQKHWYWIHTESIRQSFQGHRCELGIKCHLCKEGRMNLRLQSLYCSKNVILLKLLCEIALIYKASSWYLLPKKRKSRSGKTAQKFLFTHNDITNFNNIKIIKYFPEKWAYDKWPRRSMGPLFQVSTFLGHT